MKKKMLAGILTALMVVSVTGCSSVTDAVLGGCFYVGMKEAEKEYDDSDSYADTYDDDLYDDDTYDNLYDDEKDDYTEDNGSFVSEDYGSYSIPDGWIKEESPSTSDNTFYIRSEDTGVSVPNNISVNFGTNKYSESEVMSFKDAILQQLTMQVGDDCKGINGSGDYSDNGYAVLTFDIESEDCETVQYYIVGEKKYCLVHLTIQDGDTSAKDAAREIVDSFVWAE